jgi:hypothetical protein
MGSAALCATQSRWVGGTWHMTVAYKYEGGCPCAGWDAMVRRLRHPVRARAQRDGLILRVTTCAAARRLPELLRKGTSASAW